MAERKPLSRRQFLQLGPIAGGGMLLKPEQFESKKHPIWPESVLEIAGAELVGVQIITGDKFGATITQETRLWKLPPLIDFPNSNLTPLLLVTKDSPQTDSGIFRATTHPSEKRLLLVPSSEIGKKLALPHDSVYKLGELEIGIDDQTNFWFVGGTKIQTFRIPEPEAAINKFGLTFDSPLYQIYHFELIEGVKIPQFTESGWILNENPSLSWFATYGNGVIHNLPLPNDTIATGPENESLLVADYGLIKVVNGMKPFPYTTLIPPTTSFWSWIPENNQLTVFRNTSQLNPHTFVVQKAAVQYLPEDSQKIDVWKKMISELDPTQPVTPKPDNRRQTNDASLNYSPIRADIRLRTGKISRTLSWPKVPDRTINIRKPVYEMDLMNFDSPEITINGMLVIAIITSHLATSYESDRVV